MVHNFHQTHPPSSHVYDQYSPIRSDLKSWREIISNTLGIIEKMEGSIKGWDENMKNQQQKTSLDMKQSEDNTKV
jgi:hypothetical protein